MLAAQLGWHFLSSIWNRVTLLPWHNDRAVAVGSRGKEGQSLDHTTGIMIYFYFPKLTLLRLPPREQPQDAQQSGGQQCWKPPVAQVGHQDTRTGGSQAFHYLSLVTWLYEGFKWLSSLWLDPGENNVNRLIRSDKVSPIVIQASI